MTLLFGVIGLPLPIDVAAVLAGSLAALDTPRWEWAGLVAVLSSFAGGIVAYTIGRAVNDKFLNRHGSWIGCSGERRTTIEALLRNWAASP